MTGIQEVPTVSDTTARSIVSRASETFHVQLLQQRGLQEDICHALDLTERWHQRDCALKAPLMVSFVVLLALHRHESIKSVLTDLLAHLRITNPDVHPRAVTPEAAIHARTRLGVEPLKALFDLRASAAIAAPTVFGLRPWAIDGVRFLLPDTPANEEFFLRPKASRGRAAFPQMLGVLLVSATSRMVRDVVWGKCTDSERDACRQLIRHLGPDDVLFGDRGLAAVWLAEACLAQKTHFVFRVPSNWKPLKIRSQGPGDHLAIIKARVPNTIDDGSPVKKGPKTRLVSVTVRIIEYRIGRHQRVRLMTNLLDPAKYPAVELAQHYHLRWEGELAFDEIKTHFATVLSGTLDTTFRSKTPNGVLQEAYAVLLAYNLLRELMHDAAERHDVPALEISFAETLAVVRRSIVWFQCAPRWQVPQLTETLLADVAACRRRRSRRLRACHRTIKVKMSNWPLKRPQHRQRPAPIARGVRLVRRYVRKPVRS
jgi:hypothetical protein